VTKKCVMRLSGDLSDDVYDAARFTVPQADQFERLGGLSDVHESLDAFLERVGAEERWDLPDHIGLSQTWWAFFGRMIPVALAFAVILWRVYHRYRRRRMAVDAVKKVLRSAPFYLRLGTDDAQSANDFFAALLSDREALKALSFLELRQLKALRDVHMSAAVVRKFCEQFKEPVGEECQVSGEDALSHLLRRGGPSDLGGAHQTCQREVRHHVEVLKDAGAFGVALSVLSSLQVLPFGAALTAGCGCRSVGKAQTTHRAWRDALALVVTDFEAAWKEQGRIERGLGTNCAASLASGDLAGLEAVGRQVWGLDNRARKVLDFARAMSSQAPWTSHASDSDSPTANEELARCRDMVATLGKLREAMEACKNAHSSSYRHTSRTQRALHDLEVAYADVLESPWSKSGLVQECERLLDQLDAAEDDYQGCRDAIRAGQTQSCDFGRRNGDAESKAEVASSALVLSDRRGEAESSEPRRLPLATSASLDVVSVAPAFDILTLSIAAQRQSQQRERNQRRRRNRERAREHRAQLVLREQKQMIEERRWRVFSELFLTPVSHCLGALAKRASEDGTQAEEELQTALERKTWQFATVCASVCSVGHLLGYLLSDRSSQSLDELVVAAFEGCVCSERSPGAAAGALLWWDQSGFLFPFSWLRSSWLGSAGDLLFLGPEEACSALGETLCQCQTVAWAFVTAQVAISVQSVGFQLLGTRLATLPITLLLAAPTLRILARVVLRILQPVAVENVATAIVLALAATQMQRIVQRLVAFPLDRVVLVLAMALAHVRGCVDLQWTPAF